MNARGCEGLFILTDLLRFKSIGLHEVSVLWCKDQYMWPQVVETNSCLVSFNDDFPKIEKNTFFWFWFQAFTYIA